LKVTATCININIQFEYARSINKIIIQLDGSLFFKKSLSLFYKEFAEVYLGLKTKTKIETMANILPHKKYQEI